MELKLTPPDQVNEPVRVNPSLLVFYGKEGIGKTTIAAQIPDAYVLVISHEGAGADYIRYRGHRFSSLEDLEQAIPTLKQWYKEGKIKRLVVDSIDALLSLIENRASQRYGKLIDKEKKPIVATVFELGYGKGNDMAAQLLKDLWAELRLCCDDLIFVAHCKAGDKTTQEVAPHDVDLPGKLRNFVCYKADATAYAWRTKEGEVWFTFFSNDASAGKSRPTHLQGKKLKIASTIDGKLVADWSQVYLPEPSAQAKQETKQAEQKA